MNWKHSGGDHGGSSDQSAKRGVNGSKCELIEVLEQGLLSLPIRPVKVPALCNVQSSIQEKYLL